MARRTKTSRISGNAASRVAHQRMVSCWSHLPHAFAKMDAKIDAMRTRAGIFRAMENRQDIANEIEACIGDMVELKHDLLPQTSDAMRKYEAANTVMSQPANDAETESSQASGLAR